MKNKLKILAVVCLIMLTSGCGNSNYIVDENNNIVKYEETGQMLQKDILCLPDSNGELYKLYEKYSSQLKNNFDELPSCNNFQVNSNKSSGLWELLFVKPLAWLIIQLGNLVGNLGFSLILIGLAIRLVLLPFTIKSMSATANMKKAQPEIEKINRKYQNRNDNEAIMAKSQETMLVYKKYKVNPMLGCLMSFLQLPIFLAFLRAIYRTPAIYEETLFGFNLGMTPSVGLSHNNYLYILLLALIAVSTYFSFRQTLNQNPTGSNPDAEKQMKIMLWVMLVLIVYASFSLPTALSFYWIVTYAFIAIQNQVMKMINNKSLTNKPKRTKQEKEQKKDRIKDKLVKKEGMKYGKNN